MDDDHVNLIICKLVVSCSVAVHFFRIRIRESGLNSLDPDPYPGDPKRPDPTGSGSYLDIFYVKQNEKNLYGIFLPNLNITPKSK